MVDTAWSRDALSMWRTSHRLGSKHAVAAMISGKMFSMKNHAANITLGVKASITGKPRRD
jgi:hypothetical protein